MPLVGSDQCLILVERVSRLFVPVDDLLQDVYIAGMSFRDTRDMVIDVYSAVLVQGDADGFGFVAGDEAQVLAD